jgi:hypothetical protein
MKEQNLLSGQKQPNKYWQRLPDNEIYLRDWILVLADEFRQGNVPPSKDIARLVDEAYETLPPGPWRVKVRSNSAGYQQECLDRWHNRGWEFAVSADISQGLKREIERVPDDAWHLWRSEKNGVIKEWAEVPYMPTRHYERKDSYPYRYVAIRLRRQQGELFRDGTSVRHTCFNY